MILTSFMTLTEGSIFARSNMEVCKTYKDAEEAFNSFKTDTQAGWRCGVVSTQSFANNKPSIYIANLNTLKVAILTTSRKNYL